MLPKYSKKQQYHTDDQNASYYKTEVVKYHILRILRWQNATSTLIQGYLDLSQFPQKTSSVYNTTLLTILIYNQLPSQEGSLVLP
jgi:hypothetical protein